LFFHKNAHTAVLSGMRILSRHRQLPGHYHGKKWFCKKFLPQQTPLLRGFAKSKSQQNFILLSKIPYF